MSAILEPIVGRYFTLQHNGAAHRVYFEEAGSGPPLLCLHTAGADGRQFRDLLNDPEVTRRFRVVVFDMPWHGKSSPPKGWEDQPYQLTKDAYVQQIIDVMQALELERPICIGCSIGGRVTLHLALQHPEKFRALIGLEVSTHSDEVFDVRWLDHAEVNVGPAAAGYVSGMMAPTSPSEARWETTWHYMQAGPGVFFGDLHYYKTDGDLRGMVDQIRTERCPLYMLTGEYDYAPFPYETLKTAESIPGAKVTIMKDAGHFPMSENYGSFRKYLLPILDELSAGSR